MTTERRSPSAARIPLTPEEIVRRSFSSSFRGADQTEVHDFLVRIADDLKVLQNEISSRDERIFELERKLSEPPEIDEAMVAAYLGEEAARVLQTARQGAADKLARAEEVLRTAEIHAEEERDRFRSETEEYATELRESAEADAKTMLSIARERSQQMVDESRAAGRSVLDQAQELRTRVLQDLSKRRRVAYAQVEQLLAGRDHLLETVESARAQLERLTEALLGAEAEARTAAEAARDRSLEEMSGNVEEYEAALPPVESPAVIEEDLIAEFVEEEEIDEQDVEDGRRSNALRIVRRKRRRRPPAVPTVPGMIPSADEVSDEADSEIEVRKKPAINTSVLSYGDENEGITILPRESADSGEDANGAYGDNDNAAVIDLTNFERKDGQHEDGESDEVDALFARMRADRERAVSNAEAVIANLTEVEERQATANEDESGLVAVIVEEQAPSDSENAVINDYLLNARQDRDDALMQPISRFSKQLKRLIQDEQNEVLDAIRNQRGRPSVEALPNEEQQEATYISALSDSIKEAIHEGMQASASGPNNTMVETLSGDLNALVASEILVPVRRKLSQAIVTASDSSDDVERAVIDSLSNVYRELKNQRLELLSREILSAAYARGVYAGANSDTTLMWVVDDLAGPCDECSRNAGAGAVPAGTAFPSGHKFPPIHPGCRCLIVSS